jgi:hypothetical protein
VYKKAFAATFQCYQDLQHKEEKMKRMVLILAVFFIVVVPQTALSSGQGPGKVPDNVKISAMRHRLEDSARELSLVKEELARLCPSMTAHQAVERELIRRSQEDIAYIESLCRYMEDALGMLLLVDSERIAYYNYLKKFEIQRMKKLLKGHLERIEAVQPSLSDKDAVQLIDRATKTVHAASPLLAHAVETVQHHSEQVQLPHR